MRNEDRLEQRIHKIAVKPPFAKRVGIEGQLRFPIPTGCTLTPQNDFPSPLIREVLPYYNIETIILGSSTFDLGTGSRLSELLDSMPKNFW